MSPRTGTVVFFDLTAFSTTTDPEQMRVAQSFMDALKAELAALWQEPPSRSKESPYLVLPTGDGAATILWDKAPGHPRRELTALWLAGKILVWANSQQPAIGVRCGINSGELDFVSDPYDTPNVCRAAINVAQRIMDAAEPGQVLAHETFAQRLSPSEETSQPDFQYCLGADAYEVLAKHNERLKVQAIMGKLIDAGEERPFGLAEPPAHKWHLQIEPPILDVDDYGVKRVKKPPVELLLKHSTLAFVGATNHQLAGMLQEATRNDGAKIWESITVLFLADEQVGCISKPGVSHSDLLAAKATAMTDLEGLLTEHAKRWQFLEYERPFYFASYWDWDRIGGRIHVSPYIWGADVGTCPGLDYAWITEEPTPAYQAYREGLRSLLQQATRLTSGNA